MNDVAETPGPSDAAHDAAKRAAELAKLQAEADKARADAEAAATAAAKAEREERESSTPSAVAAREAKARKEAAESEKDAAAARQKGIAAMVPDFGKIDRGKLEVKGEAPLYGTALAQQALKKVAASIATVVADKVKAADATVLITSDAQLADSDVAYHDVMTGLRQLIEAGGQQLEEEEEEERARAPQVRSATAVIGAVAAALPGAISLLSAQRTITTSAVTVGDLAAAAATAGALLAPGGYDGGVVHDTVRLLPDGIVAARVRELDEVRLKLVEKKRALETEQSEDPTEEATLNGDAAERRKQLVAQGAAKLAGIDTVVAAIDAFMVALRAVPEGGVRSPLAAAMLREGLHAAEGDEKRITHLLLVKSEAGSAQQLIADKPLWFDDKFSVVVAASVTYMLLELPDDRLVAADTLVETVQGHGKIGTTFELRESG